jgi:hypothetical protein
MDGLFSCAETGRRTYRGGPVLGGLEAVLVHDPVGLLAVGRAAAVEDERLPHPDEAVLGVDGLVPPRGLPEAGGGRPVGAGAGRVLLVLVAEEVPLVLLLHSDLALLCPSQM